MIVAHAFADGTLSKHSSRFSRHDFTLPQLFACLISHFFDQLISGHRRPFTAWSITVRGWSGRRLSTSNISSNFACARKSERLSPIITTPPNDSIKNRVSHERLLMAPPITNEANTIKKLNLWPNTVSMCARSSLILHWSSSFPIWPNISRFPQNEEI